MSEYLENALVILSEMAEAKKMKGKDPCWDGYEMVGTKKKNGKEVPNCVPKNEEVEIYEAKVGDTVSFHHELKAAPGTKMKKSGTVEKIENDTVHVKVKDRYGVKRHQVKMSDIVKEEVESLGELKKSTLLRYTTKANKSSIDLGIKASRARDDDDMETWAKNRNKADNRDKNIMKARRKLSEEENEPKNEETELNQLFTEAMKKDEESSKKKVIKKGEQLSGKQEVVKVNPEIPNRN